ncbi:MAG: fasciclin domain-containing protein [Nitrososphaerota archaeon]|jgi:uncharacterized surface protein with fasciclin (FAS1) repeats/uncharacterized protein YegP (UPF0339 family)|nr:fasciclin domain-containing protein [Nitrososphaerota archaeon]
MADLAELIVGDVYNLNTFARAVKESGLVETLKGTGPFTVFAPVDDAFAALPQSVIDELFANKSRLRAVVNYHIISESFSIEEIRHLSTDTLTTRQGQLVKVDPHRWHLHLNPKINGVNITDRKDVAADNGVLHEIDAVLMPDLELTCSVCGQGFLNQSDVQSHIHSMHRESTWETKPVVVEKTVVERVVPVAAVVAAPVVAAPVIKRDVIKDRAPESLTHTSTRLHEGMVYEVLYDDDNQMYVYHLKDASGEIIGESADFKTLSALDNDMSLVKTDAPIARLLCAESTSTPLAEEIGPIRGPVFEQFKDDCGKWRFNLKDTPEGRIILTSRKDYDSLYATNNDIEKLRVVAPKAKIIYPAEAKKHKTYKPSKHEILTH